MYKYECPRKDIGRERVCLACGEKYTAMMRVFALIALVKIRMN